MSPSKSELLKAYKAMLKIKAYQKAYQKTDKYKAHKHKYYLQVIKKKCRAIKAANKENP